MIAVKLSDKILVKEKERLPFAEKVLKGEKAFAADFSYYHMFRAAQPVPVRTGTNQVITFKKLFGNKLLIAGHNRRFCSSS